MHTFAQHSVRLARPSRVVLAPLLPAHFQVTMQPALPEARDNKGQKALNSSIAVLCQELRPYAQEGLHQAFVSCDQGA